MNNFIIDSTYKENFVIGKNNINVTIPCGNISNNIYNGSKVNFNEISPNYMTHCNKNNKSNPYSIVDYL